MRLRFASPLALLLTVIFLLANGSFVYAELHVGDQHAQSSSTSFSLLDSQYDLNSTTVDGRELRAGRERAENFSTPKLEIKNAYREAEISLLVNAAVNDSFLELVVQFDGSHCDTPFSPRPPPLPSIQG